MAENEKKANSLLNHKNEIKQFDKFVFFFAVIDNLFFPYFWLVTIPISLPLVYYWFVKRSHVLNNNKEFQLFKIMVISMFFSTIIGAVYAPYYSYDNIVFIIKYVYVFLLYFNFSHVITNSNINIKKYLILFIYFVLAFAILYYFDKSLYQYYKNIWNLRANIFVSENYNMLKGYRFAFIWMDPNNIGYVTSAVLLYLFNNENTTFFIKVTVMVSSLVIIVATMSNGSFLSLGIGFSIYIITLLMDGFKKKKKIKIKINLLNYILFIIATFMIGYFLSKIPEFLATATAVESMERLNNNSGDSRFKIWTRVLRNIKPYEYVLYLFIGKGGVTLQNGKSISPHNGHLYWIMGYGMISYLCFMYIIFRKRVITPLKKYIWILPIFIGFTINIMIGEIKVSAIIMLLVVCSSNKRYLKSVEEGI